MAGTPSWQISEDRWPEAFDVALWFRAAPAPAAGVLDVTAPAESPAAGVARLVAALRAELGTLRQAGKAPGAARAVVVYAPDEVRDLTDTHGPVPSFALMRAVKDEFDPEHRMAPGRLADAV